MSMRITVPVGEGLGHDQVERAHLLALSLNAYLYDLCREKTQKLSLKECKKGNSQFKIFGLYTRFLCLTTGQERESEENATREKKSSQPFQPQVLRRKARGRDSSSRDHEICLDSLLWSEDLEQVGI